MATDFANPAARIAFAQRTGFDVQFRSEEYAPLRDGIEAMLRDKVREVPWIPAAAVAEVLNLPATQYGATLVAIPIATTLANGTKSPMLASWLDTANKRIAWDEFTAKVKSAETAFNRNQAVVGQEVLRAAYADTAFWNRMVNLAEILALPVRIAEQGASMFLSSNVFIVAGLVVGAYLLITKLPNAGARPRSIAHNPPRRRRRRKAHA